MTQQLVAKALTASQTLIGGHISRSEMHLEVVRS